MKRMSWITTVVVLAGLGLAPAVQAQSSEWEWNLTPYLWGSDIGLDVSVKGQPVLGVDVAFSDLVDKLDFAFSLHTEGQKGSNGILFDFMWINLGDRVNSDGGGRLPAGTEVNSDVKSLLLELGGIYDPNEKGGFALLYGIRVSDVAQEFKITLPLPMSPQTTVDVDSTLVDGFFGGRYSSQIGESWSWAIRGDIGAGDSDAVLNAVIGFEYEFGQSGKFGLDVAYRYLNMEFSDTARGVEVDTEMEFSGPMVGFRIRLGS